VVASKALGGGAPLSGVLTSRAIAEKAISKGYRQSSSHTGDPLLAAAGLATLEVIERESLLSNVAETGAYLKRSLERLTKDNPIVGEIRGLGLLLGIELVRSQEKGEPNDEATEIFTSECRRQGLLTGWWKVSYLASNIVRLMPPYVLTPKDVDEAVGIIGAALEVTGTAGAR
jgi:4-aminobutyrate aminotransferase-like enzyme